jgi:glutathione S-transferase
MKIYGVPLSVHTRKVLLAAKLKGVPCELQVVVPVAADTLPANWREISPTGLIPAIDDEGFSVADSTAIISYLERKTGTLQRRYFLTRGRAARSSATSCSRSSTTRSSIQTSANCRRTTPPSKQR